MKFMHNRGERLAGERETLSAARLRNDHSDIHPVVCLSGNFRHLECEKKAVQITPHRFSWKIYIFSLKTIDKEVAEAIARIQTKIKEPTPATK